MELQKPMESVNNRPKKEWAEPEIEVISNNIETGFFTDTVEKTANQLLTS